MEWAGDGRDTRDSMPVESDAYDSHWWPDHMGLAIKPAATLLHIYHMGLLVGMIAASTEMLVSVGSITFRSMIT
jgi:hypothetical protein